MKRDIEQIARTLGSGELSLCELQGNVFREAYCCGIPIDAFSGRFMSGRAALMLDRNQDFIRTTKFSNDFVKSFITAVLAVSGDSPKNYSPPEITDANEECYAFWLGFIYRCEQLLRCVSSKSIYKVFSGDFMRSSYQRISGSCEIHLPDDAVEVCRRLDILLSA